MQRIRPRPALTFLVRNRRFARFLRGIRRRKRRAQLHIACIKRGGDLGFHLKGIWREFWELITWQRMDS